MLDCAARYKSTYVCMYMYISVLHFQRPRPMSANFLRLKRPVSSHRAFASVRDSPLSFLVAGMLRTDREECASSEVVQSVVSGRAPWFHLIVLRTTTERRSVLSLSICLFAIEYRLLKNLWKDFDEIFGGVGRGPSNNQLVVAIRITICVREFLKGFFTYYCDSYRLPRIKHENFRRGLNSLSAF